VAIYHLSIKSVSRATGRSATAAAAYRSGSEIHDERTGEEHDYTRKRGIEHAEIVLPDSAAHNDINWPRDRAALWNAAELAEKRKDSRVAREYEVALPAELNHEQRLELVREFSREIANRYGCAVDAAIHAPHREGDERNHHAHLLATTRQITATGMGEKTTVELSDTDRKKRGLPVASTELAGIRERWAQMSNEALERHGHTARIDHRTLAAQREDALQRGDAEKAAELDREPTKHLGVAATAMERKGQSTDLGEFNRRIAEAAETGRIARELQQLNASILDVSGDLAAALKERDEARALQREMSPDGPLAMDVRRQARQAWAEMRSAGKDARQQADRWRGGGPSQGQSSGRAASQGAGLADDANGGQRSRVRFSRSLLDQVRAIGGTAADPQEVERLLREWMQQEQHEQRQREQEHHPNEQRHPEHRDPRDPREPRDPYDASQRDRGQGGQGYGASYGSTPSPDRESTDRENEHQRHRDRGLDR
jgi:hypothetical protein